MSKKISFVLIILIIFLTSCSLAKEYGAESPLKPDISQGEFLGLKIILKSSVSTKDREALLLFDDYKYDNIDPSNYIILFNRKIKFENVNILDDKNSKTNVEASIYFSDNCSNIEIYHIFLKNNLKIEKLASIYSLKIKSNFSYDYNQTFDGLSKTIKEMKINFIYTDPVNSFEVLEYGKNNNLLKKTIYSNFENYEFEYSKLTEYIIIKKNLIYNDDSQERKLIEINNFKEPIHITYLNEFGFIDYLILDIKRDNGGYL